MACTPKRKPPSSDCVRSRERKVGRARKPALDAPIPGRPQGRRDSPRSAANPEGGGPCRAILDDRRWCGCISQVDRPGSCGLVPVKAANHSANWKPLSRKISKAWVSGARTDASSRISPWACRTQWWQRAFVEGLNDVPNFAGGQMFVDEVVVYASEPQRSGPKYVPLAHLKLGG